ncbi:helix-turn-helix transcriptional regulator [Streptomyces sp. NPDC048384]|uniref:helix-turn-helix domain-containing protein n=1 Tax=Streptomyces sp. NPDC048384 TaxID=3155487 RepID=UPI00341E8F11
MAQTAASRRQLGAELARLRRSRGLKAADVAKRLGCSETRVSRIETGSGRTRLRDDELTALCDLFEIADPQQVQTLRNLASGAVSGSAWWDGYREVLPSGLEPLLAFETDAQTERAWEPVLVHGLLQTSDYAREILAAWPANRPLDIEDLVSLRAKRAELLTRENNPLELWAVLDETVIRRPIGDASIMREQIGHLLEVGSLPTVTLQMMPVSKGAHPGLGGAFAVLEFEDAPPVAYVDSPAGNLYLDRPTDVRKFSRSLDLLRAHALDPDDSAALLRKATREIPNVFVKS